MCAWACAFTHITEGSTPKRHQWILDSDKLDDFYFLLQTLLYCLQFPKEIAVLLQYRKVQLFPFQKTKLLKANSHSTAWHCCDGITNDVITSEKINMPIPQEKNNPKKGKNISSKIASLGNNYSKLLIIINYNSLWVCL